MIIRKMRIAEVQKRLLNILIKSDKPLSAQYMANRLGISSKTVRTSLNQIAQDLNSHSVSLVVHPGVGYQLVENKSNALASFKENILLDETGALVLKNDEDKAHYLIRMVLTSNLIRSIEDISELFFINSTSAKHILAEARSVLEEFELTAVFQKKGGLIVRGKEENIRFCLAYEESYYRMFSSSDSDEPVFRAILGIGNEKRVCIEALIKKYQNMYEGYNLSSYSIGYISALLCESIYRNYNGNILKFDQKEVEEFTDRNTYYAAKMIVSDVENLYGTKLYRDDVVLVAMALVSLRVTFNQECRSREEYLNDKDIALEIVQYLSRINLFKTIGKDILLINSFAQNIRAILTRSRFHIVTSQFVGQSASSYSLMGMKLAVQAACFIESSYGVKVSKEDVIRMSYLIYPVFGRFPWKFPKVKAMVVSGIDKNVGYGIRERLLRNFSAYLGTVDVFEAYELQQVDLSQYEFIFTDLQEEQYSFLFSDEQIVIDIQLSFTEQDKIRIRSLLVNGSTKHRQNKIYFTDLQVIDISSVKNRDDCLKAAAGQIRAADETTEEIYEDLCKYESYVQTEPINNTVTVTGCISHTDMAQIYVFILQKPIIWRRKNKVKVIFYWDRGKYLDQNNLFENEYLPHLIDLFRKDAKQMEDFLKNPTNGQIIRAMNEISNSIISNSISFM